MTLPDIFQFQRAMWAQAGDFSYFSAGPDDTFPFQFDTDSDSDRPSSPAPVPLWDLGEWDGGPWVTSTPDGDLYGWRAPSPDGPNSENPKIVVTLTHTLGKRRGAKFRSRRTPQYKILNRSHTTNPIKINKYLGSEQSNPL